MATRDTDEAAPMAEYRQPQASQVNCCRMASAASMGKITGGAEGVTERVFGSEEV